MLERPNQLEVKALANNMPQQCRKALVDWLERALYDIRRGNDSRPLSEIQVGQGAAQVLQSEIDILKELSSESPE